MKNEVKHPKPSYERPTIEVLGSFAELTLGGNKWHSLADLHLGIGAAIGAGGPGS